MPRLLLEARWFISLGLCLALFAILATYSKADPAWSHASFEAPRNLSLGYQLFGGLPFLVAVFLMAGVSFGAFLCLPTQRPGLIHF
jgi:hypothetical protein